MVSDLTHSVLRLINIYNCLSNEIKSEISSKIMYSYDLTQVLENKSDNTKVLENYLAKLSPAPNNT